MNIPTWVSPALYGAACGAAALAVIGFGWGGWVTGGKADDMAAKASETAVVSALSPLCVAAARRDPDFAEKLVELKKASGYNRDQIIMNAGWGTPPGETSGSRDLARDCGNKLVL